MIFFPWATNSGELGASAFPGSIFITSGGVCVCSFNLFLVKEVLCTHIYIYISIDSCINFGEYVNALGHDLGKELM